MGIGMVQDTVSVQEKREDFHVRCEAIEFTHPICRVYNCARHTAVAILIFPYICL